MKRNLAILFIFFIFAFVFNSCGNFSSDLNEKEESSFSGKISNPKFDSILYSLSVDSSLPDGTELTATVNGKSATAKVYEKKAQFNLVESFYDGIEGGTSYNATITGKNYIGQKNVALDYWPIVRLKILTDEEVTVFNGDAKNYVQPTVYINYVSLENITWNQWFTVKKMSGEEPDFNDEDITESTDASSWKTTSDMLTFLSDVANDGKYVEVHFNAYPNGLAPIDYGAGGYIVFICKKDVLVTKAEASYKYDFVEAILTDENGDVAGGKVTYQWQIGDTKDATDFSDIEDATTAKYNVQKSDAGKYLRVKIKQNWEGTDQEEIVSEPVLAEVLFSDSKIYYDGIITAGEKANVQNIKGYVIDSFGEKINLSDCTVALKNKDLEINYSQEVPLVITKASYHDYGTRVFVLAKKASLSDSEANLLSTDTKNITAGKIRFDRVDTLLEYSSDNGTTWNEITTDEMDGAVGEVFLIRKKAEGSPNTSGYIMESDAASITVKSENIGIYADGGISIDIKNLKFSIKESVEGTVVTYTPNIENYDIVYDDDCKLECTWRIDGVLAEQFVGATLNGTSLVIDTTDFAPDTYQISVIAKVLTDLSLSDGSNETEWKEVNKFAAQTTLEVK